MVQEIFFIAHVKTREISCISVYFTAFYLHNVKILFDIKSLLLVERKNVIQQKINVEKNYLHHQQQ